jgi:hypothetical protein
MRYWAVAIALGILVLGLAMAGRGAIKHHPKRTLIGSLKSLLPEVVGPSPWKLQFLPMGDTEWLEKETQRVLSYDEAIYAVYSDGTNHVAVYCAYWSPGKVSHRVVANHTPDVCWVGGGWEVKERSTRNLNSPQGPGRLLPVQSRVFDRNGRVEHVAYWHIVGKEALDYGTGREPPWYAFFIDLMERPTRQSEEQYFLRISSNMPLDEFIHLPHVEKILVRFPLVDDSSPE